jgi:Transcriptional regulators containing a DNA-binding HTH domain and an aminotransferase domain (MocR family) and their eukaryotic orthologs
VWDYKISEKATRARYLFIADRLEEDILSGELPPGTRLMTHRELAAKIGVTVATATKAYGEVQRRGLISNHVGRGTFVLGLDLPASEVRKSQEGAIIDLGTVMPLFGTVSSVKPILQRILQEGDVDGLINYFTPMGLYKHRETGAEWLRSNGVDATAESVLIANSQQHALTSIASGLFKHGDKVAVTQFTNPGFHMLMERSGIALEGIKIDESGMLPEYLDEVCQARKVRGLFISENMQNPSGKPTSDKRREELCEVIARHNLSVFEDGSFNWLLAGKAHTFSRLLPESSVYYAGLGPSLYSGLRVAFIHAPEKFHTRISQAIVENTWTVTPLCAAIACEAITDGTLTKSIQNKTKEMARRVKIVRETLADFSITCSEDSNYAWLFLPDSWQSKEFERQAEKNGVRVFSADRFIVGPFTPPNCVRLSPSGPKDIPSLKRGLDILRYLLKKEGDIITPIW